jgi:hypothetical protein
MTNKNPAQILDAYLLKFRGSKKAKFQQGWMMCVSRSLSMGVETNK